MEVSTAKLILEIKDQLDSTWKNCTYEARMLAVRSHADILGRIETKNNKHIRIKWENGVDVIELTPDGELAVYTPSMSSDVITINLLHEIEVKVTKEYIVKIPVNKHWSNELIHSLVEHYDETLVSKTIE